MKSKYVNLITQFIRAGKVVSVKDTEIDLLEEALKIRIKESDFDDHHLIAMVIVTGCQLLASCNTRHFKILKKKEYYGTVCPPKIYSGTRQCNSLLCDQYISEICKPAKKATRQQRAMMQRRYLNEV
ncbi:MAG: hypothetical protein AB1921_06635 [Thermodesulfobacteriota bacterium]